MEINKTYSKSLKKIINNTNPEQKEIANYFKRSSSQLLHHQVLPSLAPHQPSEGNLGQIRRKAHSLKVATEPSRTEDEEMQSKKTKETIIELSKNRQTSLKQTVDDIMYSLIQNGDAKVSNIKGMREQFQKKLLKNLRIVTQASQPTKKSRTHQQLQAIILNKQIEREEKLRKKYLFQNPHIQKRVDTRWKDKKVPSKDLLSFYPLIDMRQQNQQLLLNMPLKTEDYVRRLRQVAMHKAKAYH